MSGINIAGKLVSKTADGMVTEASNVEYISGATSPNGNSINEKIDEVINSTVYLTQDEYDTLVSQNKVNDDIEYNIYEEE